MSPIESVDRATVADLQSRLAFQEDVLQALNATVASQETTIAHLQAQLRLLNRKLEEVSRSLEVQQGAGDEPPPPHY